MSFLCCGSSNSQDLDTTTVVDNTRSVNDVNSTNRNVMRVPTYLI